MKEKRKLKLKKFYFHPITMFFFATILVLIASSILSNLGIQATYNIVNETTKELVPKLVSVENLLTAKSIKTLLGNSLYSLASFAQLSRLLIALAGISMLKASGLLDTLSKRKLKKMSKYKLTFIFVFLGVISSLVSDVGYVLLIPLAALIYELNGRNPLLGIVTAFCGTAFGSGVSIFTSWCDVKLIPYTELASHLIDTSTHISLTSNLIFIIISSIIISIVGTIVIEKVVSKGVGKYHFYDSNGHTLKTTELVLKDIEEAEQNKIAIEKGEKKGLRNAVISGILLIILFIYMVIPNLPFSGLLLDLTEKSYVNQLFGERAYLHTSFTFLVSLFFIIISLSYIIGAKSVKNDKELIEKAGDYLKNIGPLLLLIFIFSTFITVWKKSNIGIVLSSLLVNLLSHLELTDIPLILITIVLIALSNIFLASTTTKWQIFSPVVVPMFMQANISPQFSQVVMRVADSITKGVTPFLTSFVIYIGYLNIYNQNKQKPITIHHSLKIVTPYFTIIGLTWILLVILWYLVGLPIGPGVYPTI